MQKPKRNLLVVHQDSPVVLSIKRALERSFDCEVSGASGVEAAVGRMKAKAFDAVLLHWDLADNHAQRLLWVVGQAGANRPYVFAFAGAWTDLKLRRALHFGADAMLPSPLPPRTVERELQLLQSTGFSSSRGEAHELVGTVGRADEAQLLEGEVDPQWRKRMTELASANRQHRERRRMDIAENVLCTIERSMGDSIDPELAVALSAALAEPGTPVRSIAGKFGVDADELSAVMHCATAPPPEGAGLRAGGESSMLAEAVAARIRYRRGEAAASEAFEGIRGMANQLVADDDGWQDEQRLAPFVGALAEHFDVQPQLFSGMDSEEMQSIAAVFVSSDDQDTAREHAQLVTLTHLMKDRRSPPVDLERLRALGALLARAGNSADNLVDQILEGASALDPQPPFDRIDLSVAVPVRRALVNVHGLGEGVDLSVARTAVDRLAAAAQPGGATDQRRMQRLDDAIEAPRSKWIGPAVLKSLIAALDDPESHPGSAKVLERLGARSDEARARLLTLLQTLLTNEPGGGVDSERLKRLFDQVMGQTGQPSQAEIIEMLGSVPATPGVQRAQTGRERLALARIQSMKAEYPEIFSAVSGLDDVSVLTNPSSYEPPEDASRGLYARAQIMATAQQRAVGESAQKTCKSAAHLFMRTNTVARKTLLGLLRAQGRTDIEKAMRAACPPSARPSDAVASLKSGDPEDLAALVDEIPFDEPRSGPLLLEIARKLRESGHLDDACRAFERALELDPGRPRVLYGLAETRAAMGQAREAAILLRQTLEIAPKSRAARDLLRKLRKAHQSAQSRRSGADSQPPAPVAA